MSNQKERQVHQNAEIVGFENVFWADPADLMRDNPAALIVNKEQYNRMAVHFSPDEFDLPQVVRVRTYSSEHKEVIKFLVKDGMTRTKYCADHKGEKLEEFPDWSFDKIRARDVTNSLLRNTEVVPLEERDEKATKLTMVQYLRLVVPPTIEHSEIASDRIAAHLINGWEEMVGEDIAERFSALAAFSFLANRKAPTATDVMLRNYLSPQKELITQETEVDRAKLEKALVQMNSIILQSKLDKEEVSKSAFNLVALASPTIGGEVETAKQIYGLLRTPPIEKKLEVAIRSSIQREEVRKQLNFSMAEAFARFAKDPNGERIISDIQEALKDDRLTYEQTHDVITSSNPSEEYIRIRQDINRARFMEYYLRANKRTELTENEQLLVDKFGTRTYLDDREFSGMSRNINIATNLFTNTNNFINNLISKQDELIKKGVEPDTIEQISQKLESLSRNLLASNSVTSANSRINTLTEELDKSEKVIAKKIKTHQLGEIVDEVYGEELALAEFGAQIRKGIVDYLVRDEGSFKNLEQVKKRLQDLNSLSPELQSRVIDGSMTISFALSQQQKFRAPSAKPETKKPEPDKPAIDVYPARPSVTLPPPPVRPQDKEAEAAKKAREEAEERKLEEERKRTVNRRLSEFSVSNLAILQNIGAKPKDIAEDVRKKAESLFDELGKVLFGRPNSTSIIKNEYQRALEKIKKLEEERLYQSIKDAQKDTRTKQ